VDRALGALQDREIASLSMRPTQAAATLQNAASDARLAIRQGLSKQKTTVRHAVKTIDLMKKQLDRLQRLLTVVVNDAGEGTDAVSFVFTASDKAAADTITCSRTFVRHWSPAFAALVRHGNGMDGASPNEVRLVDVDPSIFRIASDFMLSGKLPGDFVRPLDSEHHPLLEFADRFDLRDLVDDYFAVMAERNPLTVNVAKQMLELALRSNANAARDEAAGFLASHWKFLHDSILNVDADVGEDDFLDELFGETHGDLKYNSKMTKKEFCTLSSEAAAVVLCQHDLEVRPDSGFEEVEVLCLASCWAQHNPTHPEEVVRLLASVRFELFSFSELADVQGSLSSCKWFGTEAQAYIRAAIAKALRSKLSTGGNEGTRQSLKRKRTAFSSCPSEEDKARKMMRMALEVCGSQQEGSPNAP